MPMLSPNRLGFAIAFALLCSCSSTPPATSNSTSQAPAPSPVAAAPANSAATIPTDTPARHESFSAWQSDFRRLALSQGISVATLDQALAGLEPDPAVIAADSSQPEFTRPVWEYLDGAVSASRVKRGQQLQVEYAATLSAIEQRYAVDAQVLLAVWGMESAFGHNIGNKSVIRSLASLAYAGRRASFWQEQLLAALRILDAGDISARGMIGSWAGAMGQTQFMPTTYASHAVDFDGDGRRDIWNSASDALGSAAHYLHASGWQAGKPWGFQVALPDNFDYALADAGIRKTYAEWNALGIKGTPQGLSAGDRGYLLLPAGHRGPAFLVFGNFNSILKYNNSTSYALAIGLLSDAIRGQQLALQWPRGDKPLSRHERIELQEQLSRLGFDPGIADGIIGANTRRAVRGFQQQLGWPADGYPTPQLLTELRKR